jgi:hypothetical protein
MRVTINQERKQSHGPYRMPLTIAILTFHLHMAAVRGEGRSSEVSEMSQRHAPTPKNKALFYFCRNLGF